MARSEKLLRRMPAVQGGTTDGWDCAGRDAGGWVGERVGCLKEVNGDCGRKGGKGWVAKNDSRGGEGMEEELGSQAKR